MTCSHDENIDDLFLSNYLAVWFYNNMLQIAIVNLGFFISNE